MNNSLEILKLEKEILGSFIIDKSALDFLPRLKADDFSDATHAKIFKAICDLYNEHKEIGYFTLCEKTGLPTTFLTGMTDIIATTATIETNIKLLKDISSRRKLINKANKIKEMARNRDIDIDTIKNNAMEEIGSIESIEEDDIITLKDAMLEATIILQERAEHKDDKAYYTGIERLDVVTAGLHEEELTTIAARPGVGKTAIAMQIALNVSGNGKKVMFASLEMSSVQLCQRILAGYTGIDGNKIRRGDLDSEEWKKTFNVAEKFRRENFLLDKTSRNVQNVRTKIRKYKPDLVIIDYLQLLKPAGRYQSREQEVASMTGELKRMTLEFKIPIVILSQLNRNAQGNKPSLADLRESGAIEQDSDNVFFLHEPTSKEIEKLVDDGIYPIEYIQKVKEREDRLTQIIIGKQRNGPVGTFEMVYVPRLMRFINAG